jgi:hypothetical protein
VALESHQAFALVTGVYFVAALGNNRGRLRGKNFRRRDNPQQKRPTMVKKKATKKRKPAAKKKKK